MKSIKMKKLALSTLIAAAIMAVAAPAAQAAVAPSTFNVNIALTTTCLVSSVTDIALIYTSFQATASSASSPYTVTCTNLLPYTMAVGAVSVVDSVLNLTYTVAVQSAVGSVVVGGTGNGAAQAYKVAATIAGNQSGTYSAAACATTTACSNATATNKLQTLTITY